MEEQSSEDKEDSGFSLGDFLRTRFILRTLFGQDDEDEKPASVIQVDPSTGSSAAEEETPNGTPEENPEEETKEETGP